MEVKEKSRRVSSDNQSNSDFRSPATVLAHGVVMNNFNMFANETNNTLLQNISEKEMLDKVKGIYILNLSFLRLYIYLTYWRYRDQIFLQDTDAFYEKYLH